MARRKICEDCGRLLRWFNSKRKCRECERLVCGDCYITDYSTSEPYCIPCFDGFHKEKKEKILKFREEGCKQYCSNCGWEETKNFAYKFCPICGAKLTGIFNKDKNG